MGVRSKTSHFLENYQNSQSNGYPAIDGMRLVCAFLVIAAHVSPLANISPSADFILVHIVARIAVPFFFMTTGYFVLGSDTKKTAAFLRKTGQLYGIALVLYLPLYVYVNLDAAIAFPHILQMVLFQGTAYHLWYLPAAMAGVLVVSLLLQYQAKYVKFWVSGLFLLGLLGDSYHGLAMQLPWLKTIYDGIFAVFLSTRNGIFLAPMFLYLGYRFHDTPQATKHRRSLISVMLWFGLLLLEGMLIHQLQWARTDVMYVSLLPCLYALFAWLLGVRGETQQRHRNIATILFLMHPWVIVFLRGIAKVTHTKWLLVDSNFIFFVLVSAMSYGFSLLFLKLSATKPSTSPDVTGRAWVEIDLTALQHNYLTITKSMPSGQVMAVIKANAYGHGAIAVAHALEQVGCHFFAVATIQEAIELRQAKVKADVLVLGYTNPIDIPLLECYDIIQTVVSQTYAIVLHQSKRRLRVHLKLDTGMHRLGEWYANEAAILELFTYQNLQIEGVFSHLATADQISDSGTVFAIQQMSRYFNCVKTIRQAGFDPGILHLLSSAGWLQYPEVTCDYVRIGLALFGIAGVKLEKRNDIDLRPVLSLKSRIVTTKMVDMGESIGYGLQYIAMQRMRIGVVAMGYGDGYPRGISGHGGMALVNGKVANIVGNICMDQCMIDLQDIPEADVGAVVTFIGTDKQMSIGVEEVSKQANTIPNELLSRLGDRLARVYTTK